MFQGLDHSVKVKDRIMDRKTKLWKRTEGVKKEDSYKDATQ